MNGLGQRDVVGIEGYQEGGDEGDLAVEYLSQVTTRRCVAFLVSDFIAENYEKALRIASRRHDVIAITMTDPREVALPEREPPPLFLRLLGPLGSLIWWLVRPPTIFELEDVETGETLLIDGADENTSRGFGILGEKQAQEREGAFRSMGVDYMDIRTDRPYLEAILRFFRMRERRLRK